MNRNIWVALVILFLFFVGFMALSNKAQNEQTPNENLLTDEAKNNPNAKHTDISGTDPNSLVRAQETKKYISEKLGISFYYYPRPVPDFEVTITEVGNKIYVHGTNEEPLKGKKIEVFTKDADMSFQEAIKQQFIPDKPEQQCWVQINDEKKDDTIVQASITYPEPTDEDAPWWDNYDKCNKDYAAVNGVRYFVMDTSRPTKYLFLDLGQDSIASDGTAPTADGGRNWSSSIEIL